MAAGSFIGKVITVTGAASGIGHATARACAERGANLALADLNNEALDTAISALRSEFPEQDIVGTKLDITDSAAVDAWIVSVIEHFGRIDGAANIAGVVSDGKSKAFTPIIETTDEFWKFILDINLTGTFYCLRAQLRVMKQGSSIVNAASTAGVRGGAMLSAYTASKHGVVGLTKTAAKEAGSKGIRVNAVCPGPVDTPLLQKIMANDDGVRQQFEGMSALGRLGKVEDIANAFCYLLSDDSSWVSATTITIDGGAMGA